MPHLVFMNPIAFHLFSWPIYWYGIMYLISFLGGWGLLSYRSHTSPQGFSSTQLSDIVFATALGVILGGRIGYMLFYGWHELIMHPLSLFQVWQGGMSFHGGLLGVLIALLWCAKKMGKPWLSLTDFIAPVIPFGLGAGRIGNFINGELWGRTTNVPWAMIFPQGGYVLRHPSQLYEFGLEGVLLFVILWIYSSKPRPLGAVSGLFALLYGLFRCFVEFYREPDAQVGYLAGGFVTEGQLLSIPLIIIGIWLLIRAAKHPLLHHRGRVWE